MIWYSVEFLLFDSSGIEYGNDVLIECKRGIFCLLMES